MPTLFPDMPPQPKNEWQGSPNPVVRKLGPDPEGRICRDCTRLYYRQMSKRYYKCDLRKETGGPGSDHRVFWKACSRFEARGDTPIRNSPRWRTNAYRR